MEAILTVVIFFAVTVLLSVLVPALWGASAHGLLRLTGSTAGPMKRTVEGICYASGANVLMAVPCLGVYFGWIWWIVSAVLMVREGQKVHGGRAALAVLTLPVVTMVGGGVAYGFFVFWAVGNAQAQMARAQTAQRTAYVATLRAQQAAGEANDELMREAASGVVDALDQYAWTFDAYPKHASALGADDPLLDVYLGGPDGVVIPGAGIALQTIGPGGPMHEHAETVVAMAAAALGDDVVAHRLGRFVFTYHGMDPQLADDALWTVVSLEAEQAEVKTVFVGTVEGTVIEIPAEEFAARLTEQNRLRAAQGLAALPDPARVTAEMPAEKP